MLLRIIFTFFWFVIGSLIFAQTTGWRADFDREIKLRGHLNIPQAGESGCDNFATVGKTIWHFEKASYRIASGHLIYPGSFLQASSLESGQLVSFAVNPSWVSPFEVLTDPPLELTPSERYIENPSPGRVQTRVKAILSKLKKPPAEAVYFLSSTNSFERALLEVGISADWLGGAMTANLKNVFEAKRSRFIIRIQQNYLTLSRPDSIEPSRVFSEAAKHGVLERLRAISGNDTLAFVSSVTYGREIIGAITSDLEYSAARQQIVTSANAFAASLKAKVINENSKIGDSFEKRFYILGGSTLAPLTDLDTGLRTWLNEGYDPDRAAMISFSAKYLDNYYAKFVKTADFPCPIKYWITGFKTDVWQVRGENLDRECKIEMQITIGGRIITARKNEEGYNWNTWVELHKGEWDRNGSLGWKHVLLKDAVALPSDVTIQFHQTNTPWNEDPHFRMRLNGLLVLLRDNRGREYEVPAFFDHGQSGLFDHNPDHMNFVDNRQSTNRVKITFSLPQ